MSMIARALWLGLLVLLGLVSFGVQVDRQAMVQPELVVLVPASLRGKSQQQLAAAAIASGDSAIALAMTRDLVRKRPMPAENLMLLGQAQLLDGQVEQGLASAQAAANRGWRVVPLQIAVADAALQLGDHNTAANRIAALIAVEASDPLVDDLLRRLLASEQGRGAMAERLASNGRWQRRFVRETLEIGAPKAVLQTLAQAEGLGFRPSCPQYAALVSQLPADQRAAAIQPERCGQA